MKTPLEALAELVSRVDAEADDEEVSTAAIEFGLSVTVAGELSQDVAETALRLLKDEAFLRRSGSWHLVYAINGMWDEIADDVRTTLFEVLEQGFDGFGHFLGPFVIAEMVGEKLGGEPALAVFERLAARAGMPARALIPHGLEYLARATSRSTVRSTAIDRLNALSTDSEEDVRDEVQLSLENIQRSPPN